MLKFECVEMLEKGWMWNKQESSSAGYSCFKLIAIIAMA